MNIKSNFLNSIKTAAFLLSLLGSVGSALANTGNSIYTNISGVDVNVPTFYANSPIGYHGDGACFTKAGGVAVAAPAAANPICNTGTALRKFVDQLPLPALPGGLALPKAADKSFIANPLASNYIPVGVPSKWVNPMGVATSDDYYEIAVVEYQQKMHMDLANPTVLRGYVQIDPYTTDLNAGLSNGATQIKINGTPITTSVALKQIDGTTPILIPRPDASIPASTLVLDAQHIRGADGVIYKLVQAYAVDNPQYLGPVLTASKGMPTRIKFINLLPAGHATGAVRNGDIGLPVDETLPGAGYGPDGKIKFSQNRAMIHLHGGDNPWISDGTPHQWITPAGEALPSAGGTLKTIADLSTANNIDPTHYLKGWSAVNVPDMPDPGPGAMTYYYPNGESARLEWYHDHTFGLTRLNVYEGMASAYFLSDSADGLAAYEGVSIPAEQIPLVIEDKTFVPKDIATEDARWDATLWGGESSLWYPHVYETNQLPTVPAAPAGFPTKLAASIDGTYPPGRWDWGPWFWPVFPSFYDRLPSGEHIASYNTVAGKVANSGLSEVTVTPEAFMDTAVVNGKAYPTLTVDPKAYRLRILNAANDRYFNLGFYLAADKVTTSATSPKDPTAQPVLCDGLQTRPGTTVKPALTDCTEVKMVGFDSSYPAAYYPTLPSPFTRDGHFAFPTTGGPMGTGWGQQTGFFALDASVPDPATAGPSMTMIGNETGYLASAVNIPSTIVNYEISKQAITILNVKERGVLLNPAGRVDVVVDFSQYAGKTLILYNDTAAPVPAADPRLDYRTGMGDNSTVGGAENVLPGYGPNTRTLMQVYVNPTNTSGTGMVSGLDQVAINSAVQALFTKNQPKPIVPPGNYGSINTGTTGAGAAYIGFGFTTPDPITYTQMKSGCTSATTCNPTLVTLPSGGTVVNAKIENKAIQELFEPTFGRMNATLGVELPYMTSLTATTVPLGYVDPATESVPEGQVQFWRITHNGVDAHPVHFHLVNVQVINRVDWAGLVKPPTPDENGWKETVVMHPLEDVFVAVRAKAPSLPFGLPLSVRPRDPSQAIGVGGTGAGGVGAPTVVNGFTQINPADGSPMAVTNQMDNYQWEYVWHCHILGHEENDFMRPFVFDYWNGKNGKTLVANVYDNLPAAPGALSVNNLVASQIKLTWTDPTPVSSPSTYAPDPKNEIGYHLTASNLGTTQAATTVNKSATVTLAAANANILVGMAVSGAGIPAGAKVSAVSGTSLTLSAAATAAGTNVTLTFNSFVNYDLLANSTSWIYPAPLAAGTTYTFSLVGYNALGSGNAATVNYTATSTATVPTIASTTVTARSITVNWNSVNSVVGTSYFVQYSTDKAKWVTLPIATATATSSTALIDNLLANTSYYVRVGASTNAGATAAYSAISTVNTLPLPAVSLRVSSTGPSTTVATATVSVTWVLPQGGGTPVLTYTPSGGTAVVLSTLAANATSKTITGLPANTAYTLSLVINGANGISSEAVTSSFTTNVLPATIAAATSITASSASIAWTPAAGVTSQTVNISPSTVAGVSGTASVVLSGNSAVLSNLATNTLYTVTVNQVGLSGVATSATKTFTTVPGSVSNVSMSTVGTNGTLSWTNPVGGGTVTVTSTSTAITIGTVAANATSVAITKLVAGTAYSFTITVKNGTVVGLPVTYTALAVPAPAGVTANIAAANSVVMKFTTVTGATAYNVQMATAAAGPWTNMTATTTTVLTAATATATLGTNFTNSTYYFRVVATMGINLGTPSASVAVNMSTVPAVVTGVGFTSGVAGSKTVTIAWTKGVNVTGVDVTRSQRIVTTVGASTTSSWSGYTTVGTVTGGATTYVDTTLTSGQVYQYKIVAKNPAGTSTTAALPAAGFTAP